MTVLTFIRRKAWERTIFNSQNRLLISPKLIFSSFWQIFWWMCCFLSSPAGLAGSPVISDISLIRLSPGAAGESSFLPPHSYVSPHVEHYLRSAHASPTLSMISAARGLSPADGQSNSSTALAFHHFIIFLKYSIFYFYVCLFFYREILLYNNI